MPELAGVAHQQLRQVAIQLQAEGKIFYRSPLAIRRGQVLEELLAFEDFRTDDQGFAFRLGIGEDIVDDGG